MSNYDRVETPIATPDRNSLVLVYYDVQDRSDAERAAYEEPPGSDRDEIRNLLTSGKLGIVFERDTESVYGGLMLTSQVENVASAIAAALPHHRMKTRIVMAYALGGVTPTIQRRLVFTGKGA